TDHAISAYLSYPNEDDLGKLYLHAYGLLQALFVQQDALAHAAEAIGLEYQLPDELKPIRKIRNDAVGHPTKRGNKHPESFGIIQISLCHESFTVYSFKWDNPDEL